MSEAIKKKSVVLCIYLDRCLAYKVWEAEDMVRIGILVRECVDDGLCLVGHKRLHQQASINASEQRHLCQLQEL